MITAYDFIPKCMKYMVLFVNIMYWILGAIAIGIGLYVHRYHLSPIRDYISMQVNPVFITIFLGILLFITAVFGFVGALRENLAFMKWYLGTLLLLLMIHVVFGASAFVIMSSKPSVSDHAEEKFQRALFAYKDDDRLADFMNNVQTSLQCCGINGFTDWNLNPYFACDADNYSMEKCSVPASCCRLDMMEIIDLTCGYGVTREDFISKVKLSTIVNTKGCIPRIEDIIQSVAGLLGFSSLAIATSLFFGVILANRAMKTLEAEVNTYWNKMESENHVVPYDGYNGFLMPETGDLQKTGHLASSELEYNVPTSL